MAAIPKYVPVAIGIKGGVVSAFEPGSVKLSPALQRELYRAGGPRPKQAVVLGADPVTEFSVPDIKLFTGLAKLSAENPLTLYFAKLDDAGGFSDTYLSVALHARPRQWPGPQHLDEMTARPASTQYSPAMAEVSFRGWPVNGHGVLWIDKPWERVAPSLAEVPAGLGEPSSRRPRASCQPLPLEQVVLAALQGGLGPPERGPV